MALRCEEQPSASCSHIVIVPPSPKQYHPVRVKGWRCPVTGKVTRRHSACSMTHFYNVVTLWSHRWSSCLFHARNLTKVRCNYNSSRPRFFFSWWLLLSLYLIWFRVVFVSEGSALFVFSPTFSDIAPPISWSSTSPHVWNSYRRVWPLIFNARWGTVHARRLTPTRIRNESVPKNKFTFITAISILVISRHDSFRVLFDKIV